MRTDTCTRTSKKTSRDGTQAILVAYRGLPTARHRRVGGGAQPGSTAHSRRPLTQASRSRHIVEQSVWRIAGHAQSYPLGFVTEHCQDSRPVTIEADTPGGAIQRPPAPTVRRTFNPWVLGSSPRRPTARDSRDPAM